MNVIVVDTPDIDESDAITERLVEYLP